MPRLPEDLIAMATDSPLRRLEQSSHLLTTLLNVEEDREFLTVWPGSDEKPAEKYTFGEFRSLCCGYVHLFQERGVKPGNTVALVLPQGAGLMAAFAGSMLLGAVPTILAYPNFKIDPVKYQSGLHGVTRNLSAALLAIDESLPAELVDRIEGQVIRCGAVHPSEDQGEPQIATRELAFIQHSAGTTGLQKGVALTHRVVLNQLIVLGRRLELNDRDRIVSWLPLYHDMGLIAAFMLPLAAGLPLAMMSPVEWVLDPSAYLRLAARQGSTLTWLPNFAFQFMARRVAESARRGLDLSALRAWTNTSEPIRERSFREFHKAFRECGVTRKSLQTSYGMAEATFAVMQSIAGESPRVVRVQADALRAQGRAETEPLGEMLDFVSTGHPLESVHVRIVDEQGNDLPDGRVGEILVSCSYLFSGYYNRPDLTRTVLEEGWYRTRDIGFRLGDDLFVMGRADDTIIVGGRNFFPTDIEELAFSHPAVKDGRAVAFGVDNPDLGTQDLIVIAEVASPQDLQRKQSIALEIRHSIVAALDVSPRQVRIVAPGWLIKSTAGKPARTANREKFLRSSKVE